MHAPLTLHIAFTISECVRPFLITALWSSSGGPVGSSEPRVRAEILCGYMLQAVPDANPALSHRGDIELQRFPKEAAGQNPLTVLRR